MKYLTIMLALCASTCAAQNNGPATVKPTIVQAVVKAAGLQSRIMWMDATANLDNMNSRAKIAEIMEKCRRANINTVVVDVKPLVGEVLYPSAIAPRLTSYPNKQVDPNLDVLGTAIEEGRRRNLKVYASANVFSEGHKLIGRGPAYQKPHWQSVVLTPDRAIVTDEGAYSVAPSYANAPPTDSISAFTPTAGAARSARPNEVYSVIADGLVQATVTADSLSDGSAPIPENGILLVGVGSGGQWMADRLRPGVPVWWESTDRLVPIALAPTERISMFVNPIAPEPRAYALSVIREIAEKYEIDGIVFDRMRYASLATDFSDLSRQEFEKWAGVQIQNWPADIYQHPADPSQEMIRGPYFEKWLEWRATNMHAFAEEATSIVRQVRPGAKCAAYVGSWYPVYYGVGVNWGSDDFYAGYDWMTESYNKTGYAPLLDWICTGTYYQEPFRSTARQNNRNPDATVEAAAALSNTVVSDAAYVYASLNLPDYVGKPGPLIQAIQAAVQESQGIMLFDLVYVIQNGLWGVLEQTFTQPAIAPHDVPELLGKIRDVRSVLPPIPAPPPQSEDWRLVVSE